MVAEDKVSYKASDRLAAAVLILIGVACVVGLQWLRSKGTHFDLLPGREYGFLLRLLHVHAFHFRNTSGWLLIHGLVLTIGWGTAGLGSARSVHRVTNAITLWNSFLGFLLLASLLLG